MDASLLALAALIALVGYGVWRLVRLSPKQKKRLVKKQMRELWNWLERRGIVERNPAFVENRHELYSGLDAIEANHATIKKEVLELLEIRDAIPTLEKAGGGYTKAGVHAIQWKSFMLKSGRFIEENCARAPETTKLLRQVSGLSTAFFSILEPHQHITPHFGYYKGFLRYHLGVKIPNDNTDRTCWLRVNDDPETNEKRDRSRIGDVEKYYWHEGEGVLFDDTYLHDAANESDDIRVVLFLDLRKPMPWYIQMFNIAFLWIGSLDPSMRKMRRRAAVRPEGEAAA